MKNGVFFNYNLSNYIPTDFVKIPENFFSLNIQKYSMLSFDNFSQLNTSKIKLILSTDKNLVNFSHLS